jgi:uncharacterized protein YdhG (YjbR/CyaY superfamily)
MSEPNPIDAYIEALPTERQGPMRELSAAIAAAAPDARPTIAYRMPAYRTPDGRFLVSFDAYLRHYSLFPWSDPMLDELGDELRPYAVGKGTIQFPIDRPIPTDLVRRIVEIRLAEVEAEGRRR